jgi:DNA-binding transcriptional LysR family regulator
VEKQLHNLEPLLIFIRVAEMGSFTRAAQSLGIQKGRASTVVRALEAKVGARLLHRTTRNVQLTGEGQAFHMRASELLAAAEALHFMFADRDTPVSGRLRINLPTVLARHTIFPALPDFIDAYPDIDLQISLSDRQVDLVREGFDCVLRAGSITEESLLARPLGALMMASAASPEYLERHGVPKTIEDLRTQRHRVVRYATSLGSTPGGWMYPTHDGYESLALSGVLTVDSVEAYYAAGLAGIGLIQAGLYGLALHLASGELVEVLPDLRPRPLPVWLVVAHRRNLSRRVRAFMHWLEGVLAPYLQRPSAA